MKFSELIPLVACVINCLLALFVFSREPRSVLSRVYLVWGVSLCMWNLGTFFMFRVAGREEALFWAKFLQLGVIFLPISLFHLAALIAGVSCGRALRLLYGFQGLLAVTLLSNFFVAGVKYVGYAWYTVGGPGFWFFSFIYTCLTFTTMIMLYRKSRYLASLRRMRVKSLMWGCGILIFFGNNDILPILGIYYYPGTNLPIYPLGSLAAIFYGVIAAYSVLQHQLLDIHVTLGRMAAHLVRLSFMFMISLVLLLIVQTFFSDMLPRPAFFISLGVFFFSSAIASKFFPRLFGGGGSDALERRILGDRFEYHDRIHGFIQSLPWYTDTKMLMDDFHNLMTKTVKVRNYYIVLLDETTRKFSIFRSLPQNPTGLSLDVQRDSPVFQYFQATREDFLVLNVDYGIHEQTDLERRARQHLKQFNAEFCFGFFSDSDPVGLLLVGSKVSGEPYTPHDLHLLRTVVKNMRLIMDQIRLKQRVLVAEEMELLGRMSRGMAHDLNNLITPIWTYLQLATETARPEDSSTELLPTVTRNVETIQTYIKESLFYSNTLKPHFQPGRLDLTVQKAVELLQPQFQAKGVAIKCENLPPAQLEMDAVLIQRMAGNLLGNANDASPFGSTVEVRITNLAKTENSRDWFRLEIIDQGAGISPEHLPHVFRPYFTTKDRGSGRRGFGLGLAICRKIVVLHGGNLSISSEENKGTIVTVDLPSKVLNIDRNPGTLVQAIA
jgi:nitrogen-specific signal transduction histidine kinase